MKKRQILLALLLCMSCIAMTGCGKEAKTNPDIEALLSESSDEQTETAEQVESSEESELAPAAEETQPETEEILFDEDGNPVRTYTEEELEQYISNDLDEDDMIPEGAEDIDTYHVREGLSYDLMNGSESGKYDIRVSYTFDYGTTDGVLLVWWENLNVEPVEFVPYKPAPEDEPFQKGCYLIENLSSPGTYVFDVGECIPGTFLITGTTNAAMEGVSVTLMEREELKKYGIFEH